MLKYTNDEMYQCIHMQLYLIPHFLYILHITFPNLKVKIDIL